jgi:integral membrane protein
MSRLVTAYRILAYVVGVLLAFGSLVVLPCKYLLTDGSTLQSFGETASTPVFLLHGYIYIVYLVVAVFLAVRVRWTLRFTLLVLVAGVIPLLIFWVEHWVMQRLRADNPEQLGLAHSDA